MRHVMPMIAALCVAGAGAVMSQSPPRQPAQQPQQMTHMQQMHETMAHLERVRAQVQQLNTWMQQHGSQTGFQQMGQAMDRACDQLQSMLRQMDHLRQDPALQQDKDRLRDMDRLHDRLNTMAREMDEAQQALRNMAGG